ncbi:MAG: L-serine ammonia-lyase, iron-sulfur-dependent subunit beta [Clostridia bacterium]
MNDFGVFDIIGPRMIGPSSSHTAGAARLSNIAFRIANRDVVKARLTLYGSFAETGRGHGTDKALVAGILGMQSDDDRLRFSMLLAEEAGVEIEIIYSDEEVRHPNTVKIETTSNDGSVMTMIGSSIGGGNVIITGLNGMDVNFSGDYPTMIVNYEDAPGAISLVTGILAKRGINVAFMRVFRKGRKTTACMVIETDGTIPSEVADEILKRIATVHEVRII